MKEFGYATCKMGRRVCRQVKVREVTTRGRNGVCACSHRSFLVRVYCVGCIGYIRANLRCAAYLVYRNTLLLIRSASPINCLANALV